MPLIGRAQICGGPSVRQVREKASISGAGKKMKEPSLLGTTLEQRFAIGPEAGGAKKGRICAIWYNNNHNQLMHLLKRFFIQTQPIYAFGYAPFLL